MATIYRIKGVTNIHQILKHMVTHEEHYYMDEIDLRSEQSFIDSEIRCTCGLSERLLIGLYGHVFLNR